MSQTSGERLAVLRHLASFGVVHAPKPAPLIMIRSDMSNIKTGFIKVELDYAPTTNGPKIRSHYYPRNGMSYINKGDLEAAAKKELLS